MLSTVSRSQPTISVFPHKSNVSITLKVDDKGANVGEWLPIQVLVQNNENHLIKNCKLSVMATSGTGNPHI